MISQRTFSVIITSSPLSGGNLGFDREQYSDLTTMKEDKVNLLSMKILSLILEMQVK